MKKVMITIMSKREENLKEFNASREDLLYDLEKLNSCFNHIRAKDPSTEIRYFS